ncbi:hypothetical protein [Kaustia mangrovi]|nr:hypothetical protein [Kaustia mangrovi]
MTDGTIRIAMWSGPRNISTAMMRSFENRPDCAVWDEPFYAAYLAETGIDHPMRAEVLAAGETDWRRVRDRVLGDAPGGKPVFYQKHMTHHMVPGIDRSWISRLSNAFLIRAPERVLASYARKRADVALADIGFVEQAELFDMLAETSGAAPPVIDADDVLANPRRVLGALCRAVGIEFREEMLSWPPGQRDSDGVWAAHWYGAVERSQGFQDPPPPPPPLDDTLKRIADEARPCYERLKAYRL